MSKRLRRQLGYGLILLLTVFGLTRAAEVFLPATVESHLSHDHSDSEHAYCGCVTPVQEHHCIHSNTTLDIGDSSPAEAKSGEPGVVEFRVPPSAIAPAFDYYRLRAPPSAHV